MNNQNTTVGVVLGRFQLPALHEGHKAVISEVQRRHERVVLIVASAPVFLTRKNPLSGEIRKALLEAEYQNQNVLVAELQNHPSDEEWSKDFDRVLAELVGDADCIIYGARDNSLTYYSGRHETHALDLDLKTSATAIREKIKNGFPENRLDLRKFAEGVIYAAHNTYPVSYTAVDLAILRNQNGKLQVLLCGKKTDPKDKWRFCGGFVDPGDATLLDATKREKDEELGKNLAVDGYQFIGDTLIDDWRYRGSEHCIRSMFHLAWYQWGKEKPRDDIERAKWIDLEDIDALIVQSHKPLAEKLKLHLKPITQ